MSDSALKCASRGFNSIVTAGFCLNGFNDDLLGAVVSEPTVHNAASERLVPLGISRSSNNRSLPVSTFGNGVAILLKTFLKLSWLLPGRARARFIRLRRERQAVGPGRRPQPNILDTMFDTTLDRLGNLRNEPSWWRRLVLTAEGDYILPNSNFDPHFLRIPSVRDWLTDCFVRADLKVLAKERLLAGGTDTSAIRERLALSYSRYTSDDPALAGGSIDTVLFGLIAGALSVLSPSERFIAELMREVNLRINTTKAEIRGDVSRIEKMLTPLKVQTEKQCERVPARPNQPSLLQAQG